MRDWIGIDWDLFRAIKTINWRAVDEKDVWILAKDRFGEVLREDISFEDLVEEMEFYDRIKEYKKLMGGD